ncbi:hemolysin family protein [Polaromonas sp.]|jgi:CBS domain containing-hemolysin-like protein|uniref:hemolysin family protein n=1 Tax=Polaromonas sp. TaxID=1869339 RepID=UPI0037CA4E43
MDFTINLLALLSLVVCSAFLSIAEIAVAASGRIKLRQLADKGDLRAERVLAVQAAPGRFLATVQVGLNVVSILGGIVGNDVLSPHFEKFAAQFVPTEPAKHLGFMASFLLVTSAFTVLADLVPRALAMNQPERFALPVVGPLMKLTQMMRPIVVFHSSIAGKILALLGQADHRDQRVTSLDIITLAKAGTVDGAVDASEQRVIENIFDLDTRSVESVMTPRENVVYLLTEYDEAGIRATILKDPYANYLVCSGGIDIVTGYVSASTLFQRVLRGESLELCGEVGKILLRKVLIVPDRLTLSEMLSLFRQERESFAVIVNEYNLVVGVITLTDLMSTVMGGMVVDYNEMKIVQHDDGSFIAELASPILIVQRALGIEALPNAGQYDTLAGLLVVLLRRVPRCNDSATWAGWNFEVTNVGKSHAGHVMISRSADMPAAAPKSGVVPLSNKPAISP